MAEVGGSVDAPPFAPTLLALPRWAAYQESNSRQIALVIVNAACFIKTQAHTHLLTQSLAITQARAFLLSSPLPHALVSHAYKYKSILPQNLTQVQMSSQTRNTHTHSHTHRHRHTHTHTLSLSLSHTHTHSHTINPKAAGALTAVLYCHWIATLSSKVGNFIATDRSHLNK
jgi:hypothetical protein